MLKDFTKTKFDILIQAGQSNSDGTGHGAAPNCYEPNDTVWFLNQNFTISQAQERVAGNQTRSDFPLEFARRYVNDSRLKNGRNLLIIRSAVGGTGFSDNRWGLKDDLFLQMMQMIKTALSLNSENRLVAFLWHQGENDAFNEVDYNTHRNELISLINTVRSEFAVPDLSFIAGDFVQLWLGKNEGICAPIRKAMCDICADIGNAAFVETDGLKSNYEEYGLEADGGGDEIHFSRAALYKLGERYYEKYVSICG